MTSVQIVHYFSGYTGRIEGLINIPENPNGIAILSHPHPLFGGSMTNKVIHTMNTAFIESGWITVRHNFRGVGQSEGTFTNGDLETMDLLRVTEEVLTLDSVVKYFQTKPRLILAGFSFGSYVSSLASTELNPEHMVLAGTPAGKWSMPHVFTDTTLIHGDIDEVIPLQDVFNWAETNNLSVNVIPGASHFFDKKLSLLKTIVKKDIKSLP